MESATDICYICHGGETEKNMFMNISPCMCTGSNKIHWFCFRILRQKKEKCDICKEDYIYYPLHYDVDNLVVYTSKLYYKSGNVRLKVMLDPQNRRHGKGTVYYDNPGKIKRAEGYYKHDSQEVIWKEYYESGELKAQYQFIDEKKQGIYKEYYKTGELKSESVYKNDNIIGPVKYYNTSGILEYDSKGDYYRMYYECGAVKEEGIKKKSGYQGLWKEYYECGSLKAQGEYKDGIKQGKWKIYEKPVEIEYVDGERILGCASQRH